MKSLLENAQESAQEVMPKGDDECATILRAAYCRGYCAGVKEAIEILKNMPEYFEAIDYLEFKIGIDRY